MTAKPPTMEPRELKDGSGWYVRVTWPTGAPEDIDLVERLAGEAIGQAGVSVEGRIDGALRRSRRASRSIGTLIVDLVAWRNERRCRPTGIRRSSGLGGLFGYRTCKDPQFCGYGLSVVPHFGQAFVRRVAEHDRVALAFRRSLSRCRDHLRETKREEVCGTFDEYDACLSSSAHAGATRPVGCLAAR